MSKLIPVTECGRTVYLDTDSVALIRPHVSLATASNVLLKSGLGIPAPHGGRSQGASSCTLRPVVALVADPLGLLTPPPIARVLPQGGDPYTGG